MIKKTAIITITLAMALLLMVSFAQARKSGGPHGGGPDLIQLADELKLTDDQLKKIGDIKEDTHRKMIDHRASLEKAEMDMKDLWKNGIPTDKQVNAQIDRISSIKIEMEKIRASKRIEMLKTLTESQLADLDKLKIKHRFGPGPMREGMPGMPSHPGCLMEPGERRPF